MLPDYPDHPALSQARLDCPDYLELAEARDHRGLLERRELLDRLGTEVRKGQLDLLEIPELRVELGRLELPGCLARRCLVRLG